MSHACLSCLNYVTIQTSYLFKRMLLKKYIFQFRIVFSKFFEYEYACITHYILLIFYNNAYKIGFLLENFS